MTTKLTFLLACAVSMFSGTAMAQSSSDAPIVARPSGPTIGSRPVLPARDYLRKPTRSMLDFLGPRTTAQRKRSYTSSQRFAECVGPGGQDLLKSDVGSSDEREALSVLTRKYRRCLGRSQSVEIGYLRGAFAEELAGDTVVLPSEQKLIESDRYHLYLATLPGIGSVSGDPLGKVVDLARCQVAIAPHRVRELLDTDPGSRPEGTAIDTVFADSRYCGGTERPSGISPIAYRAIVAEAFYHWVRSDLTPRRQASLAGKHSNA